MVREGPHVVHRKKTEKHGASPLTRSTRCGSIATENEERENMTVNKWRGQLNAEHDRLKPLYDEMTADQTSHWKEPFTAVVPADEFDDYSAAAVFFVGAPLVKLNDDYEHTGVVDVSCVGYYAAADD